MSGPSGIASEAMEGDARKSDDSYDWSLSTPHEDLGTAELESSDGEGKVSVDGTDGVI